MIEELERGVVLVPRREVGPYPIREDGLQSLESTRRSTHAFPAAVKRTGGQDEASDVVQMRMTNKETMNERINLMSRKSIEESDVSIN